MPLLKLRRIGAHAYVLQSDKTKARPPIADLSPYSQAQRDPGRAALESTIEKDLRIPDSRQ
jgi:hypothetical protein